MGMNVNVVKITQTNSRMLILTKANSFLVLYIFYLKIANIDYIISPEARGFLFGCPVANKLNIGDKIEIIVPKQIETINFEIEKGTV